MSTVRNHVPNPSFEVDTTGWDAVLANKAVIALDATRATVGAQSLRITRQGSSGNGQLLAMSLIPWDEAAPASVSLDLYWPATNTGNPSLIVQSFRDGSFVGPSLMVSVIAETIDDEWVRVTRENITPNPDTNQIRLAIQVNGASDGETFNIDAVMLNEGPAASSYFDGDTPNTLTTDYSWDGVPHASTSTAYTPETTLLDFGDLDQLAADLRAQGIRTATVNPSKMNLPGVLIEPAGVELDGLAHVTINAQLYLVAGDKDPLRAMADLGPLFNKVAIALRPYGGPTGPTRATTVVLPGSSAELPCLVVPIDLLTTNDPA